MKIDLTLLVTPKLTEDTQKNLIQALIDRQISITGVDFAGVRNGTEHTPTDQKCADHGVFIVENLCNLHTLLNGQPHATFKAYTFPMNFSGMTGLPCRVIGVSHQD